MNIIDKTRLLQTSMLTGLMMSLGGIAYAQTSAETISTDAEVIDENDDQFDDEDTIVVTGSRIKRNSFNSISPLQVITADTIIDAGLTNTADIIKSQTVISGVQLDTNINSSFVTNGGPGASNVSLRGLGEDRTLVLVNGRRFAPAGVEGAPSLPDLNLIPSTMIQRVDTLLDGASSIYGSDAIAGVINVILRDEFEGFRLDGSITQPIEANGGGGSRRFGALMGSSSATGNYVAAVEYRQQDELDLIDRDFQRADNGDFCSLDIEFDSVTGQEYRDCGGAVGSQEFRSASSPFGTGPERGNTGFFNIQNQRDRNFRSGDLEAFDNLFNDQEALTAYVSANQEIDLFGHDTSVFFETSFSNVQTSVRQGFHGQLFPSVAATNPTNPLGFTAVPVVFSPIRRSDIDVDVLQYRLTAGLEGDLEFKDNWSYEVFGTYSRSIGDSIRPVVLEDRLALSLATTVQNPDGSITCGNDFPDLFGFITQETCVPVNLFAPSLYNGANPQFGTQAERDYLEGERSVTTKVDQYVVGGFVTGPLFDLPAGEVNVVLGAEYREDGLDSGTDTIASQGGAAGFFADQRSIGSVGQYEVFAEIDIPLVKNKPFFEDLSVNLSGRFVDNEFYSSEFVYGVKGQWAPTDFLTFKGTYGTSYRSPGVRELFLAGQSSFSNAADPCIVPLAARNNDDNDPNTPPIYDGTQDNRSPVIIANCITDGVDPTSLGINGSASIQVFNAGNVGLDPETSEALTLGVSFDQPFTDAFDLLLSASYFDIKVNDALNTPSAQFILNTCYNSTSFATEPFCSRLNREATGFISRLDATPFNLASFGARGVDFNMRASFDFDASGRTFDVTIDNVVTHQFERESQNLSTSPISDASGDYGFPKWRGNSNIRVSSGDVSAFWGTRFVGKQNDITRTTGEPFVTNPDGRFEVDGSRTPADSVDSSLSNYFRFDASVRYNAGDDWSLVLGMNNVFDKNPPTVDQNIGQTLVGNVPAGVGYDVLGRSFFVTASKTF